MSQLAEVTDNTKRGARGLILPASTELGNAAEETLLPGTVAELDRLGIKIREVAVDGGFKPGPTNTALADLQPKTVFIAGRQEPASRYLAYFRARGMAVSTLPAYPSSGYGCWTSLGSTTSSLPTEFQGFVGHRAAVPTINPDVAHQADPTPLLHITPPDDHHCRHPGPSCTSPTGMCDAQA